MPITIGVHRLTEQQKQIILNNIPTEIVTVNYNGQIFQVETVKWEDLPSWIY